MSIDLPVDGIIQLHYVENLTGARLVQFAKALQRLDAEDDDQVVGNFFSFGKDEG